MKKLNYMFHLSSTLIFLGLQSSVNYSFSRLRNTSCCGTDSLDHFIDAREQRHSIKFLSICNFNLENGLHVKKIKTDSIIERNKLDVASYVDEFGNTVHLNFRDRKTQQAYLCTVFSDGRHRDLPLLSINENTFVSVANDLIATIKDRLITIAQKPGTSDYRVHTFLLK